MDSRVIITFGGTSVDTARRMMNDILSYRNLSEPESMVRVPM
jgi:hypothetical protein